MVVLHRLLSGHFWGRFPKKKDSSPILTSDQLIKYRYTEERVTELKSDGFEVGFGEVVGESQILVPVKKGYDLESAEEERRKRQQEEWDRQQKVLHSLGSERIGHLSRRVLETAHRDASAFLASVTGLLGELDAAGASVVPRELKRVRKVTRNGFRIQPDKVDRVQEFLADWPEDWVTVADITAETFLKPQAVGRILAHLGWQRARIAREGDRQWAYYKPVVLDGEA